MPTQFTTSCTAAIIVYVGSRRISCNAYTVHHTAACGVYPYSGDTTVTHAAAVFTTV